MEETIRKNRESRVVHLRESRENREMGVDDDLIANNLM